METMPEPINSDVVTIQDCIENYVFKNRRVILNDGKVIDFEENSLSTEQ